MKSNDKNSKSNLSYTTALSGLTNLHKILANINDKTKRKRIVSRYKNELYAYMESNPAYKCFEELIDLDESRIGGIENFDSVACNLATVLTKYFLNKDLLIKCNDKQCKSLINEALKCDLVIQYHAIPTNNVYYNTEGFLGKQVDDFAIFTRLNQSISLNFYSQQNKLSYINLFIVLANAKKFSVAIDFYKNFSFAISPNEFLRILSNDYDQEALRDLTISEIDFILNEFLKTKYLKCDNSQLFVYEKEEDYALFFNLKVLINKIAVTIYELFYDYYFEETKKYMLSPTIHLFDKLEPYFSIEKQQLNLLPKSYIDSLKMTHMNVEDECVYNDIFNMVANYCFAECAKFNRDDDPFGSVTSIEVDASINSVDSFVDYYEKNIYFFNGYYITSTLPRILNCAFSDYEIGNKNYGLFDFSKTRLDAKLMSEGAVECMTDLIDYQLCLDSLKNTDIVRNSYVNQFLNYLNTRMDQLQDEFVSQYIEQSMVELNEEKLNEYFYEFLKENNFKDKKFSDEDITKLLPRFENFKEIRNIIAVNQKMKAPYKNIDDDTIFGDFTNLVVCEIKGLERLLKQLIINFAKHYEFNLAYNKVTGLSFVDKNYTSDEKIVIEIDNDSKIDILLSNGPKTCRLDIKQSITFINDNKNIFLENPSYDATFKYALIQNWVNTVRNQYMHVKEIKTINQANEISRNTAYWILKIIKEIKCL